MIQRLPPAMRETFSRATMSGWVPMSHASEIFVQVAPLVYPTSDNALRELGREMARDNLGGPYKHFVRLMSVPFFMKQTALMWRAYHNAGRPVMEMLDARTVVLRVHEYAELPERFRECMCGWIEQAIAMTGGKDVCLTKSEDDAVHVWRATWR